MDQATLQKDPEDREMGGLCNAVAQTFQAGTLKSCSSFHNTGPGNGQSRMRKDSMESYPSWLLMGSGGGEEYLILRRPSIGLPPRLQWIVSCPCSLRWLNSVGHKTKDVTLE